MQRDDIRDLVEPWVPVEENLFFEYNNGQPSPSLGKAISEHFADTAVEPSGVAFARADRARALGNTLMDAIANRHEQVLQAKSTDGQAGSAAYYWSQLSRAKQRQVLEAVEAFRYSQSMYAAQLSDLRSNFHSQLATYPPYKQQNLSTKDRYFAQREFLVAGYEAARQASAAEISRLVAVRLCAQDLLQYLLASTVE